MTFNVDDFPVETLNPLGLETVQPDDFLLCQLDPIPPTILQVIREQAAYTGQAAWPHTTSRSC